MPAHPEMAFSSTSEKELQQYVQNSLNKLINAYAAID